MRIAICDGSTEDIKKLKIALYSYSNLQRMDFLVDCYDSGEELIQSSERYRLIFLEYHLPGIDGFQTAKELRKKFLDSSIVFLCSSLSDFIWRVFEVNPYRFIQKPWDQTDLFSTLNAFFKRPDIRRPLWIKSGDDTVCTDTGDILYLEADNKHCLIGLKDRKIRCGKTMAAVYELLPKHYFGKINRAYIVNFTCIRSYNKERVQLKNGEDLHITRTYYRSFQGKYRAFADPVIL